MRKKRERDMLEGAIRRLEEKGWCKGNFRDGRGRYCILGALLAEGTPSEAIIVENRLQRFVRGAPRAVRPLSWWNDRDSRTKKQVINLLRRGLEAL